jgi:asparagine synthase (glutamine-hydrolysing)
MLDEKLVAFGLALPHALRASLRHGGKLVLRGVAQRRLPPEIASRRKQGFGVPVDRWVDGGFRENLRELIGPRSRIADYLDSSTYQPWVDGFCSERAVPGLERGEIFQRIVMLVALELQLSR